MKHIFWRQKSSFIRTQRKYSPPTKYKFEVGFIQNWYYAVFYYSIFLIMFKSANVSINNFVHAKRMLLLLLFVVHNVRTPQSPLTQNTEVYNMTIEEASRFCFLYKSVQRRHSTSRDRFQNIILKRNTN